ncbi:MAG: GNAT family N-acetyltransferase [Catenulispora sp.]|nr:GNAT family N-acetyltransferase [Catenulispora sp.]
MSATQATARPHAEVHDRNDLFGGDGPLAAAWDRLWHSCSGATAFQHRGWLAGWWAAYGQPGRLRVAAVYEDGQLVAAMPLHLTRRGPFRILSLVGTGLSDYGGLLVADGSEDEVSARIACLASAVRRLRASVDLREVPPESPVFRLARHWQHRMRMFPDSICLEVPAVPFDEFLRTLSGRSRSRVRQKARRIDELGLCIETVRPEEVPGAIHELLELHKAQWAGRGITEEHLTERFRKHLVHAVTAMAADGCALVVRFSQADEIVACDIMLRGPNSLSGYLGGVDPRMRRYDITTMLLRTALTEAVRCNATYYSFLRGEEIYKQRWHPKAKTNTRVILFGPGLIPGAAGAALAAVADARRVAGKVVRRIRRVGRASGGSEEPGLS